MVGSKDILHLKIITPQKVIRQEHVQSVTAPAADGEITVLPRHVRLFSLLKEGVLKIITDKKEDFFAIGGGFLETDGVDINILVSRAYGQDEIDEKITKRALEDAKAAIRQSKDKVKIEEARALLRRSVVDLKLLKKRRK